MAQSERLAAIGALYQGETPSLILISKATGRSLRGLELAAKREGWKRQAEKKAPQDNNHKCLELLRRVEGIIDERLAQGVASKSMIDEILNLLKLAEKLGSIEGRFQNVDASKQADKEENEKLEETQNTRKILQKIDDRIQELAEFRAQRIIDERLEKASTDPSSST